MRRVNGRMRSAPNSDIRTPISGNDPAKRDYFPPWFFATQALYSARGMKRSDALLMQ